ncbi:MAG: hypothetical protein IGS03_17810 [Candidatus Sericytochromatia bacterium]|nr:hypothetical protein [Candidatus Sericytochromatia bacterium]
MRRKTPLVSGQRLPLLNISIFIVAASMGYVQYFFNGAPASRSLSLGIAFTLILILYIYLLEKRSQRR